MPNRNLIFCGRSRMNHSAYIHFQLLNTFQRFIYIDISIQVHLPALGKIHLSQNFNFRLGKPLQCLCIRNIVFFLCHNKAFLCGYSIHCGTDSRKNLLSHKHTSPKLSTLHGQFFIAESPADFTFQGLHKFSILICTIYERNLCSCVGSDTVRKGNLKGSKPFRLSYMQRNRCGLTFRLVLSLHRGPNHNVCAVNVPCHISIVNYYDTIFNGRPRSVIQYLPYHIGHNLPAFAASQLHHIRFCSRYLPFVWRINKFLSAGNPHFFCPCLSACREKNHDNHNESFQYSLHLFILTYDSPNHLLSMNYKTITNVPAPMRTQPINDFAVKSSCKNTKASTNVMTTLNLSMGTTFEASPNCNAL